MNTKEYDDFSDMPGQISKILESFSQSTLGIINQLPALWYPWMLGDFSDTLSSINNLISTSFVIDGIADRLLEAVDILNSLDWSNAMRNALDAIPGPLPLPYPALQSKRARFQRDTSDSLKNW